MRQFFMWFGLLMMFIGGVAMYQTIIQPWPADPEREFARLILQAVFTGFGALILVASLPKRRDSTDDSGGGFGGGGDPENGPTDPDPVTDAGAYARGTRGTITAQPADARPIAVDNWPGPGVTISNPTRREVDA